MGLWQLKTDLFSSVPKRSVLVHRASLGAWLVIGKLVKYRSEIDGLSADVPEADWPALDAREFAYDRVALDGLSNTVIYEIPEGKHSAASQTHPILLSYLDVVVQGYLNEFGEAGAALFFATTHGWEAPILNDRSAPRYPRHQTLNTFDAAFVDDALSALDCTITRA